MKHVPINPDRTTVLVGDIFLSCEGLLALLAARDQTQRDHCDAAYRDGFEAAAAGELLIEMSELLALGYSRFEAWYFHRGYQASCS